MIFFCHLTFTYLRGIDTFLLWNYLRRTSSFRSWKGHSNFLVIWKKPFRIISLESLKRLIFRLESTFLRWKHFPILTLLFIEPEFLLVFLIFLVIFLVLLQANIFENKDDNKLYQYLNLFFLIFFAELFDLNNALSLIWINLLQFL